MLCDAHTCSGCRYAKDDEPDDQTSFSEFLANCQHAKCKVVRLVRQQISKLQDTQYEHTLSTGNANMVSHNEVYEMRGEVYEPRNETHEVEVEAQQAYNEMSKTPKTIAIANKPDEVENVTEDTATLLRHSVPPGKTMDRKWMLRLLSRIRHRAHLILAAAVVGMIVWTALVYGVFLGATACGSGRTCLASSFKYTYTKKRSLF